ncbi:MAG TPA: M20/M25/M40 family metallo-hydrolase [Candidatus Polarisedimenticolia bacterium]|jgi:acetylornithine deacetylase/succinyl-diaminopimelate desuccinylase-like protein|nr:M20/M25/M40 family metallo-hydrolase [Candidatus Polarisedimenticolia bacterium]
MTGSTSLPDPRAILEEARSLRSFIVDLTLRVCRERTVNYFPEDFPGGGPDGMTSPGQEGKVTAVLAGELQKLDMRPTTHAKVPGRDNLLATVGKGQPGFRHMLVLLHTDVVPSGAPSDWRFSPFEPFEKGGKLYGRGVLDDKGPLVASFAALRILKAHEDQLQGAFTFGAVGDEEVGIGVGLPFLIEQGLIKCTDAVIPDIAGNMKEINIAEKGRVLLKVKARGKQAHAMEPAKGVNAINAMSRFLVALQNTRLRHRAHPVLGGPTVNAGLIRGGVAPNAVPADCEATLDIRYVPGQTGDGIRAEVQALADEAIWGPGEVAAGSLSVEILQDAKPCEVAPDAPIVKRILRHAPDAKITGSGGGTFAKDLVLMGVDAVGWSCGDEATYHQPNEEIEVEQLVTFAGRLANLAFEIANEKRA